MVLLEKAMAPHSSTLAWKIPWTEEPGGAAVHGVAKSQTGLSDFTFTFQFHILEKAMATHSSVLAWRIPGTGEPGGLLSMGSHRVRHDWSDLAAAAAAAMVVSKLTHPEGDQSWVFVGRTDVEAETPILWPPEVKNWLIWKDPDAGKDWGQKKGTTEDEMAGWHHRLHGREFK